METCGPNPPGKLQKYRVPLAVLVRIRLQPKCDQFSIQWWAHIGPPAKRHLYEWPANSGIWILLPSKKKIKKE